MNCVGKKHCFLNIGCCDKTTVKDYEIFFCNRSKQDTINNKIYERNIPDNLCTVVDYRPSFKVCNRYTKVVKPVIICDKKKGQKPQKCHPYKGTLLSKNIDMESYLFFNNSPGPKKAQIKNNINKFCDTNNIKQYNNDLSSFIENDIKCKLFFNNLTKRSLNT